MHTHISLVRYTIFSYLPSILPSDKETDLQTDTSYGFIFVLASFLPGDTWGDLSKEAGSDECFRTGT